MPTPSRPTVPFDIVATGQRIERRAELRTDVAVHVGADDRLAATLTDLTTRGCRLELGRELAAGSHVTLTANATMIGGSVAWSRDGTAGVEFGARLMPKAVRALSR